MANEIIFPRKYGSYTLFFPIEPENAPESYTGQLADYDELESYAAEHLNDQKKVQKCWVHLLSKEASKEPSGAASFMIEVRNLAEETKDRILEVGKEGGQYFFSELCTEEEWSKYRLKKERVKSKVEVAPQKVQEQKEPLSIELAPKEVEVPQSIANKEEPVTVEIQKIPVQIAPILVSEEEIRDAFALLEKNEEISLKQQPVFLDKISAIEVAEKKDNAPHIAPPIEDKSPASGVGEHHKLPEVDKNHSFQEVHVKIEEHHEPQKLVEKSIFVPQEPFFEKQDEQKLNVSPTKEPITPAHHALETAEIAAKPEEPAKHVSLQGVDEEKEQMDLVDQEDSVIDAERKAEKAPIQEKSSEVFIPTAHEEVDELPQDEFHTENQDVIYQSAGFAHEEESWSATQHLSEPKRTKKAKHHVELTDLEVQEDFAIDEEVYAEQLEHQKKKRQALFRRAGIALGILLVASGLSLGMVKLFSSGKKESKYVPLYQEQQPQPEQATQATQGEQGPKSLQEPASLPSENTATQANRPDKSAPLVNQPLAQAPRTINTTQETSGSSQAKSVPSAPTDSGRPTALPVGKTGADTQAPPDASVKQEPGATVAASQQKPAENEPDLKRESPLPPAPVPKVEIIPAAPTTPTEIKPPSDFKVTVEPQPAQPKEPPGADKERKKDESPQKNDGKTETGEPEKPAEKQEPKKDDGG